MKVIESFLPGVLIIEPNVFDDARGYFMETFQSDRYRSFGIESEFVQDNLSFSTRGTLRGLHYQLPNAQAKLVQVLQGEVFDVAVDIRRGSPSFGRWVGVNLSERNKRQLYIPEGFAHGFCVISDTAVFFYKCSSFYDPDREGGILWSDPGIGIEWPLEEVLLSDKDRRYSYIEDMPDERLPL
jgi:dTDP-4-dehydrorhamnose 3,5-epimerase